MNTLEKVQTSEVDNQAERARLHEYLHQQFSFLSSRIIKQFDEEDYKGSSSKQYEYAMVNYAFRIGSILSILTKFTSYAKLESTYKLKEIEGILAKRGISFNEILKIYSIPVKEFDNRFIGSIQVGVSPIEELPDKLIVTTGNSEVSSTIIVSDLMVTTFATYSDNSNGTNYSDGDKTTHVANKLYGVTVTFPVFNNMYPVLLIDSSLTVDTISDLGVNHFTKYGDTAIEGIVYDIYVMNVRAISELDNEQELTITYDV